MIQSMTGYGKAEINLVNRSFTIEIKSLNSKQIDTHIKMSSIYKDKEITLRNLISEKLQRGKIELSIWTENFPHPNLNQDNSIFLYLVAKKINWMARIQEQL